MKRNILLTTFLLSSTIYPILSAHQCLKPYTKNTPDIICAPWRSSYATLKKPKEEKPKELLNNCFFCHTLSEERKKEDSEKSFIIKAFKHCAVVINNFPYTKGHLMVIPYRHVRCLHNLTQEERMEIIEVIALCEEVLMDVINCDSFNVGMNMGPASGASMPDHLHIQIVPRNPTDTDMLNTIANINIISVDIKKVYDLLKEEFEKVTKPTT